MPTKRCCGCSVCQGVILYNTGEQYSGDNVEGYSNPYGPCAVDMNWTANGGPAFVFRIYPDGLEPPGDRTHGLGCIDQVLAITAVCSVEVGVAPLSGEGKAVIEPGGPDGFETLFESQFYIPPGVNLNRIAICGKFAADDYVKAGEWKINGIDQAHIEHKSYNYVQGFPVTIPCQEYAFTKETADLVHGWNTIAITVKNGNFTASPEGFGGPTFLQMILNCVERTPCNLNSNGWYVRVGDEAGQGEDLQWARDSEISNCDCHCKDGGEPPLSPPYAGFTYDVPCKELHE